MTGDRKSKDKGMSAIDPDLVRELARLLEETGLSEIEFEREGQRVRVARQVQAAASAPSRPPAAAIHASVPASEPAPLGVFMLAHVPFGTYFQALP